MRKTLLERIVLFLILQHVNAFTIQKPTYAIIHHSANTALSAIEVMTLDGLPDHEEEGERMSKSIAGWLDVEWMPQEIHRQIGQSAKATYIESRESGENEIMNIMTDVVDVLEKDWRKYDKDAFVNAWDIGNYVADYLHSRLGVEDCGCSATIFDPDA